MKRIGYLYDRICDTQVLRQAFKEASRGKKNKLYVRPYLEKQDYYIDLLQKWLKDGTLKLSNNKKRTIYEHGAGKTREIVVPKFFPDQVVHWAYCIVMKPIFMKGMYQWSCGSVKGRGNHYGIKKAQRITTLPKAKYTLKTDFKKYFQSINNDKLLELIERKVKDRRVIELTKLILDNGGDGLPIGYYTSQWFSNFYLESIDHYIKEVLRVPYYIRQVDDLVLWDSNKKRLHNCRKKLTAKLDGEKYHLTIKANWQVWKTSSRLLNFLGFRVLGNIKLLRRRTWFLIHRTVRTAQRRGYCTVHGARSFLSRLGLLTKCTKGVVYYSQFLKPILSKGEACTIVSLYDRKINLQGALL